MNDNNQYYKRLKIQQEQQSSPLLEWEMSRRFQSNELNEMNRDRGEYMPIKNQENQDKEKEKDYIYSPLYSILNKITGAYQSQLQYFPETKNKQ
jgi:vacuolar-type H+-ATPase subunit I/STV1